LGKDFVGTHTAKECRAEAVRRSVASARSTEGVERCRYGHRLNGCELGHPGCVCAGEEELEL
jgi:hypothetical protein